MNRIITAIFALLALSTLLPLLASCGEAQPATPTAMASPKAALGQSQTVPGSTPALSDTTLPPTVAAEGEADLFEVVSPTTHIAANGELQVAGIIKYKGSALRVRPDITVKLSEESGAVLGSAPANDLPTLIKPGSIIPFSVRFATPPPKWAKLDVQVTASEAGGLDLNSNYADFETAQTKIENPPAQDSMRPVKIVGTVKNIGTKNASNVEVAVVLYYADGRVADVVAIGSKKSRLAPGESSEFEAESIFATLEKQPVTRIEAVAFALVDE